MKIEYTNINTNKFHDELINSRIVPLLVESNDNKTWITFSDNTDMTAVQAVIDKHNPTPLPPIPTSDDYLLDLDFRISMIELGI